MIHLLIDTCSLRQLIDQKSYSQFINLLSDEILNKRIKLYIHSNIIKEWEKHKYKWHNDISRKINYFENKDEISKELPALYSNNQFLTEQLKAIDEILGNAKLIETPSGISNEVGERLKDRKAPFHNKIDSVSDWEILGSVANYCEIYNISHLTFISSNYTDFENEYNENNKLHSTLVSRFENIDIKYFRSVSDFFNNYQNKILDTPQNFNFNILPSSKFSYESSLTHNIVDGLYNLYERKYTEINYIPLRFLKNYYPFKTKKESLIYSDLFMFSNVNPDLIHFFKDIKVLKNNTIKFENQDILKKINDLESKTKVILYKLRSNNIYHLNNKDTGTIEVPIINSNKCNCCKCSYDNFDFLKALKNLPIETFSTKEKLKVAYTHYLLYNYESAVNVYKEIINISEKNKEGLSYIIAKYNLKHLSNLLRNHFVNKKDNTILADELDQIDLFQEAIMVKGTADYNLVNYIVSDSFFDTAYQETSEKSKDIIEHYYFQKRGGWQSSNKAWGLIYEFAQIDQFINNNYIIYNKFRDYERLFDNVLSGLFASHALDEDQGGRLEYFDNYWIQKIVMHSHNENILKYIKRYKLKSLKYNIKQNKELIIFANNLFKNYNVKTTEKYIDDNNNGLVGSIDKKIQNFLTISSFLDLDIKTISIIGENLLKFLMKGNIRHWKTVDCVFLFLDRKIEYLTKENIEGFFKLFILNSEFNSAENVDRILECLKENISTIINDDIFDNLVNLSLKGSFSFDIVINLYEIIDDKRKKIIKNRVKKDLQLNFDFNKFYLSSLYDMVPIDISKILSLLNDLTVNENMKISSFKNAFSGKEEIQIKYLDELLNLCFKFNIDTNQGIFDKFRKINKYYEWVLGMDFYNYKEFDCKWITLYSTTYYIKKMKKCSELKEYLKTDLSKSFDEKIAKIYFKII